MSSGPKTSASTVSMMQPNATNWFGANKLGYAKNIVKIEKIDDLKFQGNAL